MTAASYQEQLKICRLTLERLDQAGNEIMQLSIKYTDLLEQMRSMGYTQELLNDCISMESEFLTGIETLKRHLFEGNIQYIHQHGTALKSVLANSK